MSKEVHFIKSKLDPKESSHVTNHRSCYDLNWLKYATKDTLIQSLIKHKWTTKPLSELQHYKLESLREKLTHCLQTCATVQDIQALEEKVNKEYLQRSAKRSDKWEENRKRKESIFQQGVNYFQVGSVVWVFDEKIVEKYNRPIRKVCPIPAKVIQHQNEGKWIVVEFQVTRQWHEAGGHWIHKGQLMTFKFDPITCTWLREGLTPEVVRSIGPQGKSRYFELTYTRQYLMLPRESTHKSASSDLPPLPTH